MHALPPRRAARRRIIQRRRRALLAFGLLIAVLVEWQVLGSRDGGLDVAGERPAGAATQSPEAEPRVLGSRTGREPLVAVVHPTRPPVEGLTLQALSALLADQKPDWSALGQDGGAMRVVLGSDASAAAVWLRLAGAAAGASGIALSDEAAVAEVQKDPGALAIVRAGAVGPGVRTLEVDGVDPLLEPAEYPALVPGTDPGPVTTAIGAGDILLTRTVHRKMLAKGWTSPFEAVWERLAAADIAFANLETTVSATGKPRPGGTSFVSVPKSLEGVTKSGLDVLSLANNHTGDFGPKVLVETIKHVRASGAEPVGAGANEAEARTPVVVERNGIRFGFLAFNAIIGTGPPGKSSPGAVRVRMAPWFPFSQDDLDAVAADVKALREQADVVIVIPHWGAEYTNKPNADQQRVGRALIDAGADMIIATHAHWVQGAEIYKGKLIAYSLGNFVFDQTWSTETEEAAVVELVFWGSDLKRADFVPVKIDDAHRPRFLDHEEGSHILRRMWRGSGEPFKRAV